MLLNSVGFRALLKYLLLGLFLLNSMGLMGKGETKISESSIPTRGLRASILCPHKQDPRLFYHARLMVGYGVSYRKQQYKGISRQRDVSDLSYSQSHRGKDRGTDKVFSEKSL